MEKLSHAQAPPTLRVVGRFNDEDIRVIRLNEMFDVTQAAAIFVPSRFFQAPVN
jgi:hypothetical protein